MQDEEKIHILSIDEVREILIEAWVFFLGDATEIDLDDLKLTNYEILEDALKSYFKNSEFKVSISSSGALYNLQTKGETKKTISLAPVCLYVLLQNNFLKPDEIEYFRAGSQKNNIFSSYQYRSKILNLAKEYLKKRVNNNSKEGKQSHKKDKSKLLLFSTLGLIGIIVISFLIFKPTDINNHEDNIVFHVISKQEISKDSAEITLNYDFSKAKFKKAQLQIGKNDIESLKHPIGEIKVKIKKGQKRTVSLILDENVYPRTLFVPNSIWSASVDDVFLSESSFRNEGRLHLLETEETKDLFSRKDYYILYRRMVYSDFDLDDLAFEARVKNPLSEGGISCYDISFEFEGSLNEEPKLVKANFVSPGCTQWAKIVIGNLIYTGENYDLTNSGVNFEKWHTVRGHLKNKVLSLFLDEELIYEIPYTDDLGILNFIQVIFKGNGSLDYYKLLNSDGVVLLEDTFD